VVPCRSALGRCLERVNDRARRAINTIYNGIYRERLIWGEVSGRWWLMTGVSVI